MHSSKVAFAWQRGPQFASPRTQLWPWKSLPTDAVCQPEFLKCWASEVAFGSASRNEVVNVQARVWSGRRPLMNDWRDGEHQGN